MGSIVVDPNKDAKLVVTFSDVAGNDTTLTFEYCTLKESIRPTSLDFGILAIGDTATRELWVINETTSSTFTELIFKYGNQGIDTCNFPEPFAILPKDSIKIKIIFFPTQCGEFLDSISAGYTDCYNYTAQVKAEVGSARINITDYNFGDVLVKSLNSGQIEISNTGTVPLNITGYTGPTLSAFTHDLRSVTPQTPLTIKPGDNYFYNVFFSPTSEMEYMDSMMFISNTEKINNPDSVAVIYGRGIQGNLLANSYDWGQRVINIPPDFPAGHYDANPGDSIILLKNTGSASVIIRGINRLSDTNGSAFLFNEAALTGVVIPDSSQLYVPVQFQPNETGNHKLVLSYDNTANSTTQTVLEGFGIMPDDVIDNNPIKENFTISPNPASTAFTLKFESANNAKMQITLFDLLGNPVFNTSEDCNIGMNEKVIDCHSLETGYYIIRINHNGVVETKAVVIIKN